MSRGLARPALLKGLAFFREFGEVELLEAMRISGWKRFAPHFSLVCEGDVGHSFYILATGEVQVSKGKKLLTVLKAGACFGEMAYVNQAGKPVRSASVISGTDVTLLKIQSAALEQASAQMQLRFNKIFMQTLVERLATTNRWLANIDI